MLRAKSLEQCTCGYCRAHRVQHRPHCVLRGHTLQTDLDVSLQQPGFGEEAGFLGKRLRDVAVPFTLEARALDPTQHQCEVGEGRQEDDPDG